MKIQLKKRLLCGLLAAVLILLPLSGCGEKQQDDAARVTLSAGVSPPAVGSASGKLSAPASPSSTDNVSASAEAAPVDARQSDASSQPSVAVSAPPVEAQQVTVYVTNTGSKYHCSGCQYLAKSCIAIDLTRARQRYGPCSKCSPPV